MLLEATREHDCGWADEDDAPTVNPETGAPWDFIHLPVERRQAVWVRAMRLLADRPHVAALVAHHAVTAYARYDGDPAWRAFFAHDGAASATAASPHSATRATGVTFDSFLKDYASLRAADLISLALCHGWQDRFELDYYKGVPDGATLTLTPGSVRGRRGVVARAGAPDSEAAATRRMRTCATPSPRRAIEWVTGQVQGRPEPLPS